ncbi:hypothetical protein EVAR_64763_1 [Eumeta japonica]|uniref:Uncharacterized protein n=1 Tax=Eumeta variegata TaxID=151549 RepID=A0A4C1ZFZ0_EUMVA|nr:hypothetical protein EVAR_64763_1 [Eumeta japonica]
MYSGFGARVKLNKFPADNYSGHGGRGGGRGGGGARLRPANSGARTVRIFCSGAYKATGRSADIALRLRPPDSRSRRTISSPLSAGARADAPAHSARAA